MSSVSGLTDVAEQFAAAADAWFRQVRVDDLDAWHDGHRVQIHELAAQIAARGDATPVWPLLNGGPEHSYVALAALDEAMSACHPRLGAPSQLDHLTERYRTTGTLLPAGCELGGGLLFRWVHPSAGDGATDRRIDVFGSVRRIGADDWSRLRPTSLDPLDDLPRRARVPGRPLRIAFAPVLHSLDDVDLRRGTDIPGHSGAAWYELGPSTTAAGRVEQLLDDLDASGCDLAICPEGALDEVMREVWRRAMLTRLRPPGSRLRWLLLGSGRWSSDLPDRPHNRAVLVHRDTGEQLLAHDKFAPFNFSTRTQLEQWGMAGVLPDRPPIHENVRRGDEAVLLESRVGRVVVLVCEDVTRGGHEVYEAVRAAGPALVLTPVFARVTRQYRWEHLAAEQWWRLEGSAVAVCNSLVVPQAELDEQNRTANTTVALPHSTPYALLLSPPDYAGVPLGRAAGDAVVVRDLW